MTERFIWGGDFYSPLGIKTSSEIGCVWGLGLGLIHSDRVVCQMQFSTDWSSLRQILLKSFSGGRNNLKYCVTELAELREKNHNFVEHDELKPECLKN